MLVMAAALEALGDSYGIYGFSAYSKDNVELFIAKEPDDAFSNTTLKSIAAMTPRSTHVGPPYVTQPETNEYRERHEGAHGY